jgi:hypothetical protein
MACPRSFADVWTFSAVEHRPLISSSQVRRALVCRYAAAPHGVPGRGPMRAARLLGRAAVGEGEAVRLAAEIERVQPLLTEGGNLAGKQFAGAGAFLLFKTRGSGIVRLTVYFGSNARVTTGEGGVWYRTPPALVRRVRHLTPASTG